MNDDTSPATKGDLRRLEQRLEHKLDQKLDQRFAAFKEEVLHFIALSFETFRHDFLSVQRDEVIMLKQKDQELDGRVRRIEGAMGMAA